MLGENPSQHIADDEARSTEAVDGGVRASVGRGAAATMAVSAGDSTTSAAHALDANEEASRTDYSTAALTPVTGKRWRMLAALSAILLTGLTAAGIYLVTKKPSTVDQIVILTVPSGADIKVDSKDYGHSPVKLEQLAVGTYTLTISKDGYEPIVHTWNVAEPGPVEFKLKPIPPAEVTTLPLEEQIRDYKQRAEEAFARGYYGMVYEGSALYWAEIIGNLDSNSSYYSEMRERVRKAAHQSAQSAISRADLATAQDVYRFLVEYYPDDEEAKLAAGKLEGQLARAFGQVRELVRKADEALQAGRLTEPYDRSAYFFSKQALAIDRQNDKARQIRNKVKETLVSAGENAYQRGEVEGAIKQLEEVGQLFPEDKQSRSRVREIKTLRAAEAAKVPDSGNRRVRGLDAYRALKFEEAIPDLQHAMLNGKSSNEVVFALARSYFMTGHLDQAEQLFREVRPARGDTSYQSSIAFLGEIAFQNGNSEKAVERWKEARQLGGSTIYSVATLNDKIENVEKKQREKEAEPTPLTLQVKHGHTGLLGGSCSGTLTVNSTGVRYDGQQEQHVYASSLVGVRISIEKDEMVVRFEGKAQKFKLSRADAARFHETVSKYQQTYSPASK